MEKILSIIIPVYNTPENLLRDCLESAKNQTLKNIEIICVDDGSTDGSGKILDEYAKSDPKFKVIHQENSGVSVARNNAMKIAKGEYIKFLDSDDMIDDVAAEKSYNVAKEYDADIVKYCLKEVEMGEWFKQFEGKGWFKQFAECIDRPKVMNTPVFQRDLLFGPAWAGLYRNKFIKDNDLNFFQNVYYREDSYFSAVCLPKANKVVLLPDQLYTYKNNPISAIHNTARQAKHRQSSVFLGIKLLYDNWKSCGHFKHDIAKIEFLHWLLSIDDFKLFDVFQGGSAQFNKICRDIMDPELLQDDVINQLPIKEKIKLKSIMWIANLKTKPRKALDDSIYSISSKIKQVSPELLPDHRKW